MSLQADIPTRLEIERLMGERNPASVSIYLATDPPEWGRLLSGSSSRTSAVPLLTASRGRLRRGRRSSRLRVPR